MGDPFSAFNQMKTDLDELASEIDAMLGGDDEDCGECPEE